MESLSSKMFIIKFIMVIMLIIFTLSMLYYFNKQNELIVIMKNPTFTGEVVRKETSELQRISALRELPIHRLYVTGTYTDGEKTLPFSRIYLVSTNLYNRYEIGDIISH